MPWESLISKDVTIESMIIGVDIGGTKTYIGRFTQSGKLLEGKRFETPQDYDEFLSTLAKHALTLESNKAKIACVAVPGFLIRDKGIVLNLGNLPWQNKSIRRDLSEALGINVCIENDSKLAALAEAKNVIDQFNRVLYMTISTGIGTALVVDGRLSQDIINSELGHIPLSYSGKIVAWESFASGRAFFERYKQKAVDVEDKKIWREYAGYLNIGLGIACAAYQPEVIIFGGGLGQYLNRFNSYLEEYLDEHLDTMVTNPKLISTHYRSQSVIYGCYHYAKEKLT